MYDCHYLSDLVGLVRAWDFEGVIAWVIMCVPSVRQDVLPEITEYARFPPNWPKQVKDKLVGA